MCVVSLTKVIDIMHVQQDVPSVQRFLDFLIF